MKTSNFVSLLILLFFASLVMPAEARQGLQNIQPLDESDYPCFQVFDCVLTSKSLQQKGWNFVFDESVKNIPQELTINMEGVNISFNARYNKEGGLINGEYKLTNLALPAVLTSHFSDNSYSGWYVIASEKTVLDFNSAKTTFKVTLTNDVTTQQQTFNHFDLMRMEAEENLLSDLQSN